MPSLKTSTSKRSKPRKFCRISLCRPLKTAFSTRVRCYSCVLPCTWLLYSSCMTVSTSSSLRGTMKCCTGTLSQSLQTAKSKLTQQLKFKAYHSMWHLWSVIRRREKHMHASYYQLLRTAPAMISTSGSHMKMRSTSLKICVRGFCKVCLKSQCTMTQSSHRPVRRFHPSLYTML